jgi:hypothetical protein
MSKYFRSQKATFILIMATLTLASVTAEAAFVKKTKLKPSDVKSSVVKALAQIPGQPVDLERIEGVHQNTSRNLKGKEELLNNTATIYAVVSGTINVGQPLSLDEDLELILCSQLSDKRWICRFSVLSAGLNRFTTDYFFLEK